MCGISGYLYPRGGLSADELHSLGDAMAATLRHRGPDGNGVWVDAPSGLAIAHRRLAILDLSSQGSQPMLSADGRFVITFNGEIYNFSELRETLLHSDPTLFFRGHSDTEILLAAIVRWGFEPAIKRCNGMFAIAVWDRADRRLWLARDRLGEKPLYYYCHGGRFLFGSELKALRAALPEAPELDRTSLAQYFRYGYVPAPRAIWRNVSKLPPGCLLTVSASPEHGIELDGPRAYWSLPELAHNAATARGRLRTEEVDERLTSILEDSARLRINADVPVGAFLSGGIDSACVVAALQSVSPAPVETFTVGFEEGLFDERAEARETAQYLGTKHSEFRADSAEFFNLVRRLPVIYDEPFAEASQIPSCVVCSIAARHVKVCVSGDGGDELFGGYMRYQTHSRLWRTTRWARRILGREASGILLAMADGLPESLQSCANPILRRFAPGVGSLSHAISRVGRMCSASSREELYRSMMSFWLKPPVAEGGDPPPAPDWFTECSKEWRGEEYLFLLDQLTYLPDSNLAKMDRASMQASLEVRIPLLDHRLVEFSWQLSAADKIRNSTGKLPLRRYLRRHVPAKVLDRPKRGFAMPMSAWLRRELKPWAEELLHTPLAGELGLDQQALEKTWSLHQSGKHDYSNEVWSALALLNWASHNLGANQSK